MLLIVGGLIFFSLLSAAFAPWIYRVGGGRMLPLWQGVGDAHTAAGTFRVYVWFSPVPSGSRILPSARVSGSGYLCTPRGERFPLKVTGGASGQIWSDMEGHSFSLTAYDRPVWSFTGGGSDTWRPYLSFSGHWTGPNLEMYDDGSLSRQFLPDGTLSRDRVFRTPGTHTPITFQESNWWFKRSCP